MQENIFHQIQPTIMAKYIKQEMPDIRQTGEKKVYYRLKTTRNIDSKEFVHSLSKSFSGMSEGDIIRVLIATADHLGKLLGEGYSVTLDGIGTFKATIGLEDDKKPDTLDGNETKRNAQSLRLNGVNLRADKALVKVVAIHKDGKLYRSLPEQVETICSVKADD